jgi:tetratricopeptide (TPR) repeat protein
MRSLRLIALAAAALCLHGCAAQVSRWIVATRDRQGDYALHAHNLPEASLAYKLALQVAPHDEHARQGAVTVQLALAAEYYRGGKLEDAFEALALAEAIDPENPRVADLRTSLEAARLKRELVTSNYPSYRSDANDIRRAYQRLRDLDARIVASIQRFGYSYDTTDLSDAIRDSYALNEQVVKNTNRLVSLRQLAESGLPDRAKGTETLAPPASLLPLP